MIEPTERQMDVLDMIRTFRRDNGYPPTRSEIAQALGFKSPNAAEEHIKALVRKGAIRTVRGVARGIVLVD
jgi:repressor LexA